MVLASTGSTEVGIDAAQTAAKHLHHVMLELGGNDSLIVFSGCRSQGRDQ